MTTAFLHLSDIHIEDSKDWILGKAEAIAQTICGAWVDVKTVFVLVTGDISNKGLDGQYTLAKQFFLHIKSYLKKELGAEVHFIFVPGNHDVNLTGDLKGRESFINSILANPDSVEKGDSLYTGCLEVQTNFFNFCREVEPDLGYPDQPSLFYQFNISDGSSPFIFNCYNTAWLSKLHEEQGKTVLPLQLIDMGNPDGHGINISLYHHPDNWLEADNANTLKRHIEQTSDIVLVGHEHRREVFTKVQQESGENVQFIRADALQESGKADASAFGIVLLDVEGKRQRIHRYKWKKDNYSEQIDRYNRRGENDWKPFLRNRYLESQGFVLLEDFDRQLNVISSLPIHPRKLTPTAEDLFVIPHLFIYSFQRLVDGKKSTETISDDAFFKHILDKKRHVIYGDTFQGKTTVAKRLYQHFRGLQLLPLLVNGELISKVDIAEFEKLLKKEFDKQYPSSLWERFKQQPHEKLALIVDDFGLSNINQKRLQEFLDIAARRFEYVIAFSHSNLRLQLQIREEGEFKLSDYTHASMRPLTPAQRGKLIRRWVRLDADYSLQDSSLIKQEDKRVRDIENLVDIGIIVSYPFFIFGALLLIEGQQNPTAHYYQQLGSFGFIYEGIINRGFSRLGKTQPQILQIGLVLSHIAFAMFKNESNEICHDDLEKIVIRYNQNFDEQLHLPTFLVDLEKSRLFSKYAGGDYRFISPQLRDYYVAKYYGSALHDEDESISSEASADVKYIIQTIIHDPHRRILMFLVYEENNNVSLVKQILAEAKRIYAEYQVATFEDDIKFMESITVVESTEPLELPSKSILEYRDAYNESLDSEEDGKEAIRGLMGGNLDRAIYEPDLDEFLKAAIALKTIEVTGQLVKSLGGTIRKQLKQDLIEECIAVGLRFLRADFYLFETHLKEFLHIFMALIKQSHPELRDKATMARSENIFSFVQEGLVYGVLRKISNSVGGEEQKHSLSAVFSKFDTRAYKFVEFAIMLDHYDNPNIDAVVKFGKAVQNDVFLWKVIRRFVWDYVNYFEVREDVKQKLASAFNFQPNNLASLNKDKGQRQFAKSSPKRFLPPAK